MKKEYKSRAKGMMYLEKMHSAHIVNAIKKLSKLSSYDSVMKTKLQAELKRREGK